jgi:tetratricopeptide (TPR) repeat protein
MRRRNFLIRSCQGVAAFLGLPLFSDDAGHREQPGFDEFVSETYHDRVAAVLARWSADQISGLSKILTSEFQVTRIDLSPTLRTQVRYEIVGSGEGFYREQRIGSWDLEWETTPAGDLRVKTWRRGREVRSRSTAPVFQDITVHALGRNPSYASQLLRGADHWRTVLDGASGIDVYGHNGISVGDIDGDGLDDLYVCQPAGLPNRLYRNRGDGTFEDITESSGVGILDNTACALFADFNNQGRQDLVVVRATGPLLFVNEGGGKFRLKPNAFHFASPPQGTFTGAAAADYNRDGNLDIYFCLYTYYQGADQYKYPAPYYAAENGPPNFLMCNNGDGTFRDVTAESGLDKNNTRYSFCCGWSDYNNDGWPDLYVVNDFGRKNLYRNNGDGTFTDVAHEAGVEDVGAGMGVCWFDSDNDGRQDLYVANMWTAAGERISTQYVFQKDAPESVRAMYRKHAMGNSLFRSEGGKVFQDATEKAGVGMGRWSWSSDAWDFDHDGFLDVYVVNGMLSGPLREDLNSFFWRRVVAKSPSEARASQAYEEGWNALNEMIRADHSWSGYERNVFYANKGDGTFSNFSACAGLDFVEDGRAFALADFDGDGRLEVFLKNRNAPQLRVLKNTMETLPPSIAFRLRGTKSNRDAIGAAVTLETDSGKQIRLLQAGSGFLSQHTKDLYFGLGAAKGPVRASIHWPSGFTQTLQGLPVNHRILVEEGVETPRMEPFSAFRKANSEPQTAETLPENVETWLLVPVPAPAFPLLTRMRGKPVLLTFARGKTELPGLTIDVDNPQFEETAAIYNLLYRYLFDRRRDMALPTSFLIDETGGIVKVYRGPVNPENTKRDVHQIPRTSSERLAKALPFRGGAATYDYGRNHLSLGSVFFQKGYVDQAEAWFQLALRDDPSSAEAIYGLGSVYLKQGKTAEAQASFEQTVKMKPGYPDTVPNAWNNLGLIAARDRPEQAIGYFNEALRLNPSHFVALENLGNAYRQQKRWSEARRTLEAALVIRPGDPEANYSLGMVFAQTDDAARAAEYLGKALQFRPNYPEALNNLGILYLRTRRRDEAVAKFEECIRVAPGFDQSYLNLARVYSIEGAPEKAREILRELLKQDPGNAQARGALERLASQDKK